MSDFSTNSPLAIARILKCLDSLSKHNCEVSRPARPATTIGHPIALLSDSGHRISLCAIWPGSAADIDPLPGLIAPRWPTLQQAADTLARFIRDAPPASSSPPPKLLLLVPEAKSRDLPSILSSHGLQIILAGQENCSKPAQLAAFAELHQAPLLSPDQTAHWRAAIVPEIKITPLFARRSGPLPSVPLTPLLLDYDQERCTRLDLDLGEEGTTVLRDLGVRVITGVAGCGKTLVLVHRAALLARHFPQARLLIITHNRALIADMETRGRLLGIGSRVEWITFSSWLLKTYSVGREDVIAPWERSAWIEKQLTQPTSANLAKLTSNYVIEEFDWILDRALADDLDAYLAEPRSGRGLALREEQRRTLFELLTQYLDHLRAHHLSDWSERAFRAARSPGPLPSRPVYDHILIDEAQFFAPVWFDLLRRSLHPRTGTIFLCADPTQGFLRRRASWSKLGFDVKGRTHRLERPYRNTRALLQFAQTFYRRRLPDDDEPLNLPSPEWLGTLDQGPTPQVIRLRASQDHFSELEKSLRALRENGHPLSDILVLIAGQTMKADAIAHCLEQSLGPGCAINLKKTTRLKDQPAAVGVCHVMAATGLERPVVFLLGADDLFATEEDPRLSPEEKREKVRDHTRLIYVALTRAMERLIIFTREESRWIRCEEAAIAEFSYNSTKQAG